MEYSSSVDSLQFGAEKYSVKNLIYPLDLLEQGSGSKYDNNRVVFFINVSAGGTNSGFGAGKKYGELYDIPDADKAKFSGEKIVGKSDGALGSNLTGSNLKRLAAAIILHMPNSINQGLSVSWDEVDMDSFLNTVLTVAGTAIGDGVGAGASSATSAGARQALKNNNFAQRSTRITPGNTKQEMLFRAVDYRTFEFNYSFTPKSQDEVANVIEIIRMFRHHMLPDFKGDGEFLYVYPSEFNVKYYSGPNENKYIDKHLTAVLTSCRVDYTPNGQFTSFAGGMPQQINFTMQFKEIAAPNKTTEPFEFTE